MRAAVSALILAGALMVPAAAWGQEAAAPQACPPLKQLASIPLVRARNGDSWVPVLLNGQARLFKLDTGAPVTSLYGEAVADFDLTTRRTAATLIDINGNASNRSARVESFEFGGLKMERALTFMVLPSSNPGYDNNRRAGFLGFDLLKDYDIELDFAGGVMNLFSPEHCAGSVVYWNADTVSAIPVRFDSQGKPRVAVKLDGVELSALIDTGATGTILNQSIATDRLDLDLKAPDVRAFGPQGNEIYRKRFSSLELEGLSIANPFVSILPDKMGRGARAAGARFVSAEQRLPDLIIGSAILNRLRVYLAVKEKMLYVSAPVPPSANADTPLQPEGDT